MEFQSYSMNYYLIFPSIDFETFTPHHFDPSNHLQANLVRRSSTRAARQRAAAAGRRSFQATDAWHRNSP